MNKGLAFLALLAIGFALELSPAPVRAQVPPPPPTLMVQVVPNPNNPPGGLVPAGGLPPGVFNPPPPWFKGIAITYKDLQGIVHNVELIPVKWDEN